MGLTKNIKKLVRYGIGAKLIQPEDEIFMINQYLDLFGLDEYDNPDIFGEKMVLADILNELTDIAFEKGIIQSDDIVTRDLFDTKLMGIMVLLISRLICPNRKKTRRQSQLPRTQNRVRIQSASFA